MERIHGTQRMHIVGARGSERDSGVAQAWRIQAYSKNMGFYLFIFSGMALIWDLLFNLVCQLLMVEQMKPRKVEIGTNGLAQACFIALLLCVIGNKQRGE